MIERRCRLTEVILVGRDGALQKDSDQENLTLKRLGWGVGVRKVE